MISEIKLHEIPAALAGMLDLIQVDEETGEIEPATLESVQIASEEKIIATAMYIRRLEALNKATKETIQTCKSVGSPTVNVLKRSSGL